MDCGFRALCPPLSVIITMLIELHIQNFAVIDELRLEIGSGFNALTGETGAGKSIIVDALNAAMGERTGMEVIRTGAEKCLVEAVFDLADSPNALLAAQDYGFDAEDNTLILSREINRNGRSQARINGRAATSSALKDITSFLIDVHGQHEHQSLLQVPLHIDIFDTWIGENAARLRDQARELYTELTSVQQEMDRLRTNERERARLIDLYKFQQDEISAAKLDPDEEDALSAERIRLANAEKLYEEASGIYDALGGTEGGALEGLNTAAGLADKIGRLDPSITEIVDSVNSALASAQDALIAIRHYRDEVEANPARLEQVDDRLDLIRTLKRKYGDTIPEILSYLSEITGKIDDLANSEERSQELTGRIDSLRGQLVSVSSELTALRKSDATEFGKRVETELADLAMSRTKFEISIEPTEPGPKGADAVEFLIAPNPGEPVKPLAKIASGGEMSRIMLALKTVMARAEVPTLVFDEVDTGIGGRTAQVLGDKLASLAGKCQVICVTHLPQIASKAKHHYTIEKVVEGDRTYVRLTALKDEDRVAELARMLGAEENSSAATQHAREMLTLAHSGDG